MLCGGVGFENCISHLRTNVVINLEVNKKLERAKMRGQTYNVFETEVLSFNTILNGF